MAEIKIEKKKPIWPWIILVLVILAILYFLVFAGDDDEIEVDPIEEVEEETVWEEEEAETTSWEEQSGAVQSYLMYVSDESQMGLDHEYTNNALNELINAIQAKADDMNYDISADMQTVRQEAEAITRDPLAGTHANTIRSAGTKLANILQNMQQEGYPDLSTDVQEVMSAANGIDGAVLTLDQKDQVNAFFNEAADVLRKMS